MGNNPLDILGQEIGDEVGRYENDLERCGKALADGLDGIADVTLYLSGENPTASLTFDGFEVDDSGDADKAIIRVLEAAIESLQVRRKNHEHERTLA